MAAAGCRSICFPGALIRNFNGPGQSVYRESNTRRIGPPLEGSGYELVYDGDLLWIERNSTIPAFDPCTGEIAAVAHIEWDAFPMVSDGKGSVWLLAI